MMSPELVVIGEYNEFTHQFVMACDDRGWTTTVVCTNALPWRSLELSRIQLIRWDGTNEPFPRHLWEMAGPLINFSGWVPLEDMNRWALRRTFARTAKINQEIARSLATQSQPRRLLNLSSTRVFGDRPGKVVHDSDSTGTCQVAKSYLQNELFFQNCTDHLVTHARVSPVLSKTTYQEFIDSIPQTKEPHWVNWIGLEDAVEALISLARRPSLSCVNVSAPENITYKKVPISQASKSRRRRSTPNCRVFSTYLVDQGFQFKTPSWEECQNLLTADC